MELLDRTDIRVVFNISVFRTANVDDNYEKQKQVDYPNFLKIRISVSKDEPDTGIVGKENWVPQHENLKGLVSDEEEVVINDGKPTVLKLYGTL